MNSFSIYFKKPIILQFLMGIPSGLPLGLTAGVLTAWLSEAGVNKAAIGVFAMVAMPYAFKFVWAPLMDGFTPPFLGKRRGWMLVTQLMIAISMALMALNNPVDAPFLTGLFAFFLAFSSASHDIAKDAYRVEILTPELQGAGSASFVLGYRIGHNLITAVGTFYLATYVGWQATYLIMAVIMLALCITIFMVKEPLVRHESFAIRHERYSPEVWLEQYVISPFVEFMKRPQAIAILLFILFYRMADAFLGIMANPFYLELGFSKIQIADVAKLYGLLALTIGSLVGGAIVFRLGVIKSLWIGGFAAALSNLMFVWQAHVGAEVYALMLTISLDNLSGGLATTALLAYMATLTNLNFTATQFALLSSLSAVGRTFLTVPAGYAAEHLGWEGFFILSMFVGVPALVALWFLPKATSPQAASTLK